MTDQKKGGRSLVYATVATLSMAAASLGVWEGRKYVPYYDIAGVLTVCDGVTGPDVIPGKRYSDAECAALTEKHLKRIDAEIAPCITAPLNEKQRAAVLHWAYNVGGAGAACRSTLVKKINAQDYAGAAAQFGEWRYVRINGVLRDCADPQWRCSGIVKRRAAERAMFEGKG